MNNDLISRKALIAMMEEVQNKVNTIKEIMLLNGVIAMVESVPAAEEQGGAETEWISVAERMPDVPVFIGITRDNPEPLLYWKGTNETTVSGINIKRDMLWWKPRPEGRKEK